MKIYLESASIQEIQETLNLGILDGVATNSSLIAKESRNFYDGLLEICHLVDIPISVGVLSVEEEAMVKEGKELATIHNNIVVKCPLTTDGLKATKRLTAQGVRVSVALCRTPAQALLAAKAGAWAVSPIIECCEGGKPNEMDLVGQIVRMFRVSEYATQVLLPSVRDSAHLADAALVGSHICSMPFVVLKQIVIPQFIKNGCHSPNGFRTYST